MAKVVINGCYGGCRLSKAALDYLGLDEKDRYAFEDDRTNPKLIECIEKLGPAASTTFYSGLHIVEIPDDVKWIITNHYGIEQVEEVHRVWS